MSSPLRVLVVDDQKIVREGLATILDLLAGGERRGYRSQRPRGARAGGAPPP